MLYSQLTKLPQEYLERKINEFLEEDAPAGDVTTLGTVGESVQVKAIIEAQADIIFAGEEVTNAFLRNSCEVTQFAKDGDKLTSGSKIAEISGNSREILIKERPLLNLLQRLCGIATITYSYAETAKPYGVYVLDTRKTTPGLRLFEKYAVTCGGGTNHRADLSSGILIKDNHIAAAGSITNAVSRLKDQHPTLPIQVETENFDQIREALGSGVDAVLLDNMSPEATREAVSLIRSFPGGSKVYIESSGGINLKTIGEYVQTGINAVSVGALTHSAPAAEIHMEFIEV